MGGDGLEIERKYLLAAAPPEAMLARLGARATRIEQVYLRSDDAWVRRVRRVEIHGQSRYILTRKRDREGIVREEIEADLSPEEYGRLVAEADPDRRVIRKVRHVIHHGRWTLELDVFSEPPGLALLEVELEDPNDVPELPPEIAALVVREVSTDPAYQNHHLALRPDGARVPSPRVPVMAGTGELPREVSEDAAGARPAADEGPRGGSPDGAPPIEATAGDIA